jgi:multidrug efflux system outer membrane protein
VKRATHLASLLLLGACAVGPNYKRPELKVPAAQRGQDTTEKSIAELPWWRMFRDPTLSRYLKECLTNAYDVRIAAARVEQARAQAKAAMWAFFPTVSGQVGFGGGQGFPGVPTFLPPQSLNGIFGLTANASWEADVWGRLRRQKEAADAFAQAADEDRRGVYVTLVGDVASTYLQLRTNDLKLQIVEAAIVTRQETASFFQERVKGGVSNDLELARAEGNVADARAQAADLRQAIWQNENLLSVLLARGPGSVERGATLDTLALPPEIPAGLPSSLLERRPDLRSAEAQLHAATAVIGVRIGDVLPKLSLTGAAGLASTALKNFDRNADGVYRGFAGFDIPLPVLGGAAKLNDIDAARARAKELAALYEKTFVNALREVSNSLNAVEQLKDARAMRELQVDALRRAEQVSTLRYRGGISNYLEVITAQEQRLLAELALADAKGQQHQALVLLYRTLGGGWNMHETGHASERQAPAARPPS